MTRGFHSKIATFSIRNYCNSALLYFQHICQRGRDEIIDEPLYQGTSKSAEGYAARQTFKRAIEEGMQVEVQWQDADSSSFRRSEGKFPRREGHDIRWTFWKRPQETARKAGKDQIVLRRLQEETLQKFPQVRTVTCCCQSRHKQGCGCLSDAFIMKARNDYSFILTEAQSPEEFAERIRSLSKYHARDKHEYGMAVSATSISKKSALVNRTLEENRHGVREKKYHTKLVLSCPLHSLAYEIECDYRASMAADLVHPVLKRGHPNWLEASHNVFIRF